MVRARGEGTYLGPLPNTVRRTDMDVYQNPNNPNDTRKLPAEVAKARGWKKVGGAAASTADATAPNKKRTTTSKKTTRKK